MVAHLEFFDNLIVCAGPISCHRISTVITSKLNSEATREKVRPEQPSKRRYIKKCWYPRKSRKNRLELAKVRGAGGGGSMVQGRRWPDRDTERLETMHRGLVGSVPFPGGVTRV